MLAAAASLAACHNRSEDEVGAAPARGDTTTVQTADTTKANVPADTTMGQTPSATDTTMQQDKGMSADTPAAAPAPSTDTTAAAPAPAPTATDSTSAAPADSTAAPKQ